MAFAWKRMVVAIAFIMGVFSLTAFAFILGASYSVSEWAPVKLRHELALIKKLAWADRNSPNVAEVYELLNSEIDVQLIAYDGAAYARPIFPIADYLSGNSDRESLQSWVHEAALYRRDNPYVGTGYTDYMKDRVRKAVSDILAE